MSPASFCESFFRLSFFRRSFSISCSFSSSRATSSPMIRWVPGDNALLIFFLRVVNVVVTDCLHRHDGVAAVVVVYRHSERRLFQTAYAGQLGTVSHRDGYELNVFCHAASGYSWSCRTCGSRSRIAISAWRGM